MSEKLLWGLLTAVGAAGVIVFGLVLKRLRERIRTLEEGFECPQLCLSYSQCQLGEAAGRLFDRFRLVMLPALLEAAIVLLAAAHNAALWPWLEWVMMGLCGAALAAACAETLLLPKRVRLARMASRVKWGALILWVASLFVSLVARGAKL